MSIEPRAWVLALQLGIFLPAHAGGFLFAEPEENPSLITHPSGYSGNGGELIVSVCIHPDSESTNEMETPVLNAIDTWNGLDPVLGNTTVSSSQLASGEIDFQSVLLHEIGHCIGLAHPNLGSESSLDAPDTRFAKTLPGPDGIYSLDAGADRVIGTQDDLRGDDINLNWFRKNANDPFVFESVIDASTYTFDLSELPSGHNFVQIAGLQVARARGLPDDESVMYQGTRTREIQRKLSRIDATMVRLGGSGLDREQDTPDDYTLVLSYEGTADNCDITITTGGDSFALCQVAGQSIGSPDHIRITSGEIFMGSANNFNWFFNPERNITDRIFADRFEP